MWYVKCAMSKSMSAAVLPQILFEDSNWLVLDKPAHWLSIPGRGADTVPDLAAWLRAERGDIWVVHRLDRETSGVILFARNAESHRQACLWFEGREIKKRYEFLAEGSCALPSFRVDAPIDGAPSVTMFERKEQWSGAWRGSAFPRTGRRHQIRIHLAGRESPILGDKQYGAPVRAIAPRVMLHSSELTLPGGQRWTAPLPEDFARATAALAKEAS